MPIRGGTAYRQHQSFKQVIRERDNYTCQLCGEEGWIVDHIVPYGLMNETKPDGVRVLCHACNLKLRRPRRDSALPMADWYKWIETELKAYNK